MRVPLAMTAALLLGACATQTQQTRTERPAAPEPPASARGGIGAGGQSADAFDTTTPEERAAASAPSGGAERALGTTQVSLGDPTEGGLWLRTSGVSEPGPGRVALPDGRSAQVELRPTGGGSRLSLAAMRLLGVPLTALPTVEVFAR